jgi:large subunit ribosomal protein L7e
MATSVVPELLAKKQKRDAQWQAEKAAAALEARKKARVTRKTIFKRAEAYVKEYRQKVRAFVHARGPAHGDCSSAGQPFQPACYAVPQLA